MKALAIMGIVLLASVVSADEVQLLRSRFSYVPSLEDRLRSAAYKGDVQEIDKVLAKGAKIDSSDIDGWTPLIEAVCADQPEAVSKLLARGADVNAKGKKTGHTALTWAAVLGYDHLMEVLIAAGADIEATNAKGRTALMEAALRGHEPVAQLLLAHGANPNSTNYRGRTALAFAAAARHVEVAAILMKGGARVDARTGKLLLALRDGAETRREFRVASPVESPRVGNMQSDTRFGRARYLGLTSTDERSRVSASPDPLRGKASLTNAYLGLQHSQEAPTNTQAALDAVPPWLVSQITAGKTQQEKARLQSLAQQATGLWRQIQTAYPEVARWLR